MKIAPVALEALVGLAEAHTQSGALEQALNLLTLFLNHPSTEQESKDRIADLLAELSLALH